MKYKVLVTDKLDKEGIEILKRFPDIEVVEKETLKGDALKQELQGYDAIIVRSETKLTRDVIEASSGLKVISRAGVGVDNIDVAAATEKGIVVMNAPLGNTISTAEHTFAMMLSLARKIPFAHISLAVEGKWDRKSFKGVELYGKILGLIGLGRIGTEVALRAKAFGMKVLGYDPFISEDKAKQLGIELSPLERIYKESDFISVHTPLTEKTKGMIGPKEIEMMKKSVRIINCARGGIIDEVALANALKEGRIAGAAIDVYSKEPPLEPRNPLLDAPNCILVPHLGASTSEAQFNVAIESAEAVANFLVHGMIVNSVNMPSISKEIYSQIKDYINLSEKMGSFVSQIIEGQLAEVNLSYHGDIKEFSLITRAFLKGLFEPFMGDTVNYVNSSSIASSRGIKLVEEKEELSTEYTNILSATVKSDKEELNLWGTIHSNKKGRIVRINDYYFEVEPEGNLVFIYNDDKPGMIGSIGSIMGNYNINIASMKVGRDAKTGVALTILAVDTPLTDEIKNKLSEVNGIREVKVIKL
ncbi:MAG: phosphoglycerate dehydrogenase [Brevinematia bacterium]